MKFVNFGSWPGAYPKVERLKGASLAFIRLGWKYFPPYYKNCTITFGPGTYLQALDWAVKTCQI